MELVFNTPNGVIIQYIINFNLNKYNIIYYNEH
jgi:hypothetical protein